MVFLTSEIWFPYPGQTHESGIIAVGGDLSVDRLVLAYNKGIFPWFTEDDPILWWCPEQRMVLFPDNLHISKSMRSLVRKNKFKITYNQAFKEVLNACAKIKRSGQDGTWITDEMIQAYNKLHEMGIAQSVEAWDEDNKLAGGLYGLYLKEKGVFCGESMFTRQNNASKYAFIKMVEHFKTKGLKLVDCQIHTSHLESLGAQLIERDVFLSYLHF
jgi:leucyl/phenylalanyl-tRNA--protein transferase